MFGSPLVALRFEKSFSCSQLATSLPRLAYRCRLCFVSLPLLYPLSRVVIKFSTFGFCYSIFTALWKALEQVVLLLRMADTPCYNPTGTQSDNIFCGFSNLGTCCATGWDCLTNGLCRQHGTTAYSQGTCANSSFDPKYCLTFCNKSSCLQSSKIGIIMG